MISPPAVFISTAAGNAKPSRPAITVEIVPQLWIFIGNHMADCLLRPYRFVLPDNDGTNMDILSALILRLRGCSPMGRMMFYRTGKTVACIFHVHTTAGCFPGTSIPERPARSGGSSARRRMSPFCSHY